MSYVDDHPGYRLTTEEECRNWILELIADLQKVRAECNMTIPADPGLSVRIQRKAYRIFMVKHGSALGAIMACHRCGMLGDVAHNELRQIVVDTLVPTIVGG